MIHTAKFSKPTFWDLPNIGIAGVKFTNVTTGDSATVNSVAEASGTSAVLTYDVTWPTDPVDQDEIQYIYASTDTDANYHDGDNVDGLMGDQDFRMTNCADIPPGVDEAWILDNGEGDWLLEGGGQWILEAGQEIAVNSTNYATTLSFFKMDDTNGTTIVDAMTGGVYTNDYVQAPRLNNALDFTNSPNQDITVDYADIPTGYALCIMVFLGNKATGQRGLLGYGDTDEGKNSFITTWRDVTRGFGLGNGNDYIDYITDQTNYSIACSLDPAGGDVVNGASLPYDETKFGAVAILGNVVWDNVTTFPDASVHWIHDGNPVSAAMLGITRNPGTMNGMTFAATKQFIAARVQCSSISLHSLPTRPTDDEIAEILAWSYTHHHVVGDKTLNPYFYTGA